MLKKLLSFYIWICGLLTVGVTFFVFLYILVKGEAYLSPSFILDFPSNRQKNGQSPNDRRLLDAF